MGTKTRNSRYRRKKKTIHYFDYSLLAVLMFLVCFGLVMLYSTSSYGAMTEFNDGMWYFKKQALISLGGFIVLFLVSKLDYHFYAPIAKWIFIGSILLMALVQSPLGVASNGAKRWLKLPGIPQFQPSEFAKIAVILFIPYIICKMGRVVNTPKGLGKVFAYGVFSSVCVFVLTDNLSTAVIVLGITCAMLFVIYPKPGPYITIIMSLAAVGLIGVQILGKFVTNSDDFRLQRILVWLRPEEYASGDGYQVLQALYAIGSGGFFGKGLGNSTQKLGIIPEVQNDMILSVICEELGVFGAIVVLVLFGILLYRLLFIAQNAPDLYGSLIATGIFAHIALQVVLNIAVVSNLMPNTGITLPFISYGGTAVLFLMVEMGIALGISRTIKFET
ncbi:FtsW/RodA/SpoVE family cell cycle protein [Lachnospiraceae bacterium LCP25S3_G4]